MIWKPYKTRSLKKTINRINPFYIVAPVAALTLIVAIAFISRAKVDPPIQTPSTKPDSAPIIESPVPSSLNQPNSSSEKYYVTKVVDGDTIDIEIGSKTERVRLIGVDTPETVHPNKPVECYGPDASSYAKSKLLGKYVSIEFDESQGKRDNTDQHRLLAYVYLDGKNFNYSLIYNGYAREYTYNTPYTYQKEFKAAQDYAEKNKTGLWSPTTCPQA